MMRLVSGPWHVLQRMPYLIGTMILVGGVLGGAVVPLVQGGFEAFDMANPVLIARARVVDADAASITLEIVGEKRRDCQYIGLQAYTRAAGSSVLADAYMRRIDMPETGVTRPVGVYRSLGLWRVWPRGQAGVVAVYAQHSCSGRLVISKVAEVLLGPPPPHS